MNEKDVGWGIYTGDQSPFGKVMMTQYAAYKNNHALFIVDHPQNGFLGTIAQRGQPVEISAAKADVLQGELERIAETIAPVHSTVTRSHIANFTKSS